MARTRVLQVVTSVCAGGLSRYVLDLIRHSDRNLYDFHLACTHFQGPHFAEIQDLVGSATVIAARSQSDKLFRMYRLMHRLKPDVVHAHQEPVALIAAGLAGVPVRMETIHLSSYWQTDGHLVIRSLARRFATSHVVCTDGERAIVSRQTAARKVWTVTPGLAPSRMDGYWDKATLPAGVAFPADSFVIGTIARLDHQKGVRYLLDAFARLAEERTGIRLLIVGDGPLRGELSARCRSLKIADRVVFTGYEIEAYRYLGAMDLFVMPSLFESWGYTAAEAMAAGVPVICSAIPGPTSFIEHDQTGLLVPPTDVDALAGAIQRMLDDAMLRRSLSAAGQSYVRAHLSMHSFVGAYERLFSVAGQNARMAIARAESMAEISKSADG